MNDQSTSINHRLSRIVAELGTAQERLHQLADGVCERDWARRAEPERWSVAECVAHLNLTAEAYLPLIRRALADGRRSKPRKPKPYRRDLIGWLLWRMMGPPVRFPVKTTAGFVPSSGEPASVLVARFDNLQVAQMECVEAADGLDLNELWIRSPFNTRVRYNLYSCLSILPRHQHRHLWQAEQVRDALQPVTA